MPIEYEIALIGAATIAAVFIWHQIKAQRQIHAIGARLARMKKELDILQVQESHRAIIAFKEKSKEEAPGTELRDIDPVNIDRGDIVRLTGTVRPTAA